MKPQFFISLLFLTASSNAWAIGQTSPQGLYGTIKNPNGGSVIINRVASGYATAALANTTTSLTAASARIQYFTGSTAGQILRMPQGNATGMSGAGDQWEIHNNGTQTIAIQDSSGGAIATESASSTCFVTQLTSANPGTWDSFCSVNGAGGGTVTGPGSTDNNGAVVFNGTGGTAIKEATLTQHNVLTGGANNAFNSVAPGASGNSIISNGTDIISEPTKSRNFVYNADFRYFQRSNTPTTLFTVSNTGGYGPDRWKVQAEQATSQVKQMAESISATEGSVYVAELSNGNASAGRLMYEQILPQTDSLPLRGQTVQFSFWGRTDASDITTLRACIAEWTSTADAVTGNIISSWAATPTLVANLTCKNTPSDITISSSWSQATITVTLGSSENNIVLLVWSPNQAAQNKEFYLGHPQLTTGTIAKQWAAIAKSEPVDHQEALDFYWRQYGISWIGSGYFDTTTSVNCYVPFPTAMYRVPTCGFSSNTDALISRTGTSNANSTAAGTFSNISQHGMQFNPTSASAGTAGQGSMCGVNANAGAYFEASAEL